MQAETKSLLPVCGRSRGFVGGLYFDSAARIGGLLAPERVAFALDLEELVERLALVGGNLFGEFLL
jgi:hypothetical protein